MKLIPGQCKQKVLPCQLGSVEGKRGQRSSGKYLSESPSLSDRLALGCHYVISHMEKGNGKAIWRGIEGEKVRK